MKKVVSLVLVVLLLLSLNICAMADIAWEPNTPARGISPWVIVLVAVAVVAAVVLIVVLIRKGRKKD